MMTLTRLLAAAGLIRSAKPGGFCPACKGWVPSTSESPPRDLTEINPAALTSLVVLVVAVLAWVVVIWQSRSMSIIGLGMGLGNPVSFASAWLVMAAAMMLPSALPLVYEFAQHAEGRRGWPIATAAMGITYLSVWLVFGMLCYAAYRIIGMPWSDQHVIAGLALVVAALYALTPIKRLNEAHCRELCALHGPLPFNLLHSAFSVGMRYGLSCLGCTAGLMVSAVLIGMTSLGWMAIISGLVMVYKLAPPLDGKNRWLVSMLISLLGVAYIFLA